jgi:hypothetical protein
MPKFDFWNLNQRDIPELVVQLAHEERVEVLILAESGSKPWELLPIHDR